jgi:hypothetical protein
MSFDCDIAFLGTSASGAGGVARASPLTSFWGIGVGGQKPGGYRLGVGSGGGAAATNKIAEMGTPSEPFHAGIDENEVRQRFAFDFSSGYFGIGPGAEFEGMTGHRRRG